jgi:5-oxoprolinase (ATP-hydrolysing) subunit A
VAAIDLNSDLGEGFGVWTLGDDAALLEVVTSANVACGFHAGDPSIMRRVCLAAAQRGVRIGAQVSYPDRAGFGRRFIDMEHDDLADAVLYQIGALEAFARAAGTSVAYVKPHGALYNAVVDNAMQAAAVVSGVRAASRELVVLALPGSVLLETAAASDLATRTEAFADRAYRGDGSLVPRRDEGSVIHDRTVIVERALRMVRDGTVESIDGSSVAVGRDSLCVHGDTPGAVDIARSIRSAFEAEGITVRAFV